MKIDKVLVVDTETGGLDPFKHSLLTVSFAVVDFRNNNVIDKKTWFIKSHRYEITEEAMAVNKIDIDTFDITATDRYLVAEQMIDFLKLHFSKENKAIMVGQNVKFDKDFIQSFFDSFARKQWLWDYLKLVSHRFIDIMSITLALNIIGKIDSSGVRLGDMLSYFGIEVPEEDRHTSEGDVNAVIELFNKITELIK